jgi:ATP-dependent DNA helicase RecG
MCLFKLIIFIRSFDYINKIKENLNRIRNTETQNIEYKPSWRDEFLKVIVAFANKDGGELIIGVDDNSNLIGVKKSEKLLEDIPNKIRNKLGIIPSVKIEKISN